jgi:hypothetical protein
MDGSLDELDLGKYCGAKIMVTVDSLGIADQLLVAQLLQGGYQGYPSSDASGPPPADVQVKEYLDSLDKGEIQDVYAKADYVKKELAPMVGRCVIAGFLAGAVVGAGPELAASFAAYSGIALLTGSTVAPAVQIATVEAEAQLFMDGKLTASEFKETSKFVAGPGKDEFLKFLIEEIAGEITDAENEVTIVSNGWSIVEDIIPDANDAIANAWSNITDLINNIETKQYGGSIPNTLMGSLSGGGCDFDFYVSGTLTVHIAPKGNNASVSINFTSTSSDPEHCTPGAWSVDYTTFKVSSTNGHIAFAIAGDSNSLTFDGTMVGDAVVANLLIQSSWQIVDSSGVVEAEKTFTTSIPSVVLVQQ